MHAAVASVHWSKWGTAVNKTFAWLAGGGVLVIAALAISLAPINRSSHNPQVALDLASFAGDPLGHRQNVWVTADGAFPETGVSKATPPLTLAVLTRRLKEEFGADVTEDLVGDRVRLTVVRDTTPPKGAKCRAMHPDCSAADKYIEVRIDFDGLALTPRFPHKVPKGPNEWSPVLEVSCGLGARLCRAWGNCKGLEVKRTWRTEKLLSDQLEAMPWVDQSSDPNLSDADRKRWCERAFPRAGVSDWLEHVRALSAIPQRPS
jgi:hypothetical protein